MTSGQMRRIWLALILTLGQTSFAPSLANAQDAFYQATPAEISGPVGSVIRKETRVGAAAGATAYKVLYRSTKPDGSPIAVSGIVIVPAGQPPAGGWPIVAWAHPTTGVVPHCAPSLAIFLFQQIAGSRKLLESGYAIAATDYPGLGTPGPHPYLVGESEARAVIDSVRAARSFPGLEQSNRFTVWGHSQGGQAALFTGMIAKSYAPELHLLGVAAAAPATDLTTLMTDDLDTTGGRNLTAMTIWSWAKVYGADMNAVIEPSAIPTVDALANICIEGAFDIYVREKMSGPLAKTFLSVKNPATVEPWRSLLVRNAAGALPRDIPVFLAQGTKDQLVRPEVTQAYMQRLCKAGSAVRMVMLPGVSHGFAGYDSADAAINWIQDRFAGKRAGSDC
ncbi:MAG TPA: alpha/beta fold hydrolase [Xanthobacteraceae bacterium]|jgi:acetyl esterase/lipase|nr:alpha/beta fold hydrolase [Xanthobacteraceae bacterium]